MPKLLTIREAANHTGLSPNSMRTLVNRGAVPHINIGAGTSRKTIRLTEAHLDEFIRVNTIPASPRLYDAEDRVPSMK